MLDFVLLYPLPLAIATVGILLAFADARNTRRERPVPVLLRDRDGRKRF